MAMFDKHIDYLLDMGLRVRVRIGAISRRFGSESLSVRGKL